MEILATLGIDWKLLIAQVVNFVIVLALLTKFVYKPLLAAIDARRETIRKAMEEAADIDRQNREMEAKRDETLRKSDQEAGAILERAKMEADAMRTDIIATAHKEAEQIAAKGQRALEEERARVFGDLQDKMAQAVITLSERIMRREFSKDDQTRLMKDLEKELPTLMNV